MRWVEVSIDATGESRDAASNILIEEGCGGTAELDSSASNFGTSKRVSGYLPVNDTLESRLANIRSRVRELPAFGLRLASDELVVKWVQDEDWADGWKKFFKCVRVGRVVVRPSWEEFVPRPGDVVVGLDPGMAFGTGHHETTQMCLMALQERLRGGETVLDVGTGSGILSLAAARLGAARVVGSDVDPVAVEAARANVASEHLEGRIQILQADSPFVFDGEADIVVANIIADVIIAMAEELRSKVKMGGKLITSGVIEKRRQEVIWALEAAGLRTVEIKRDCEWVAIVSERVA
ncbi:MAG: ribosomal protein L11 methyltransferase [Armatimonadetes bacterium RBG_16_58_9]|nr:MAG: ribosomal protein L11 methyltransferase [Armatimonadetes bacterium RBG_16_58_9]